MVPNTTRTGVEPVTLWSTARHANRYTYGSGLPPRLDDTTPTFGGYPAVVSGGTEVGDGTCTRFSSATDWCFTA